MMSTTRNSDRQIGIIFLKIGLVLGLLCTLLASNNDYAHYKERQVVVLDKLADDGRYGHFYLVLKEERGIVFDLIVSPATYSQTKIGDKKIFSLRESSIRNSVLGSTVDLIIIILGAFGITFVFVGACIFVFIGPS